MAIFCLRRLLLAILIVIVKDILVLQIAAYIYSTLIMVYYLKIMQPKESIMINRLEVMNESFMLLSTYFMLVCSDWYDNLEARYEIGTAFLVGIFSLMILNVPFTIFEIYKTIRKGNQKK